MVQNGDGVSDGAEEKMLNNEEKENLAKKDEVKFISGDQQNGDAKIDIGTLDKAFTGMTKDELMKYANDPFWVRLRWIFFIVFWMIWVIMLVGAILIIINAPKCAAPTPLVWWKQGPLVDFNEGEATPSDVGMAKKISAKGVIYELPSEHTYSAKSPAVEAYINNLVNTYKETGIEVILDVTANYVNRDSDLLKEAIQDEAKRSAFFWVEQPELPNNWRSIVNGSAWDQLQPQNFVLSQFGDGKYDLQVNNSHVKQALKENLRHMLGLGVKGFRLSNVKHFILTKNLQDEVPSNDRNCIHDQYCFWTHSQTTFQEGLGDFLQELTLDIRNASNGEAFLSINEDTIRPEVFKTKTGEFGIDLPIFGRFSHYLGLRDSTKNKDLHMELYKTMVEVGNNTWLQWVYDFEDLGKIDPSAYNMFIMLLPGVPVESEASIVASTSNNSAAYLNQLETMRLTPTYMHGTFNLYHFGDVVAYSRFKSGNPGFFVVLNPTDTHVSANFTVESLPDKMTFDMLSLNFNSSEAVPKGKVLSEAIPMSPYSAAILTYVPVKKD